MNYSFRRQFDMTALLKRVELCRGEILFEAENGDKMDLKSQLSRYLFLTLRPSEAYIRNGWISCDEQDAALLGEYLVIPEKG